MRILGLIPARGGSKQIPKKNMVNLSGKKLLEYSILSAIKSKYLDNIWKIINWDIVNSRLNINKEGFMQKELIKLANHLDRIGRVKEANYIDNLLKKAFRDDFGGGDKSFAEMIITHLHQPQ